MCDTRASVRSFVLTLPGTLGPVRRHQDPLVLQWIEAAMRVVGRVEYHGFGAGNVRMRLAARPCQGLTPAHGERAPSDRAT